MFGDRLSKDQCERLLAHLAKTRLPFMCAHGRPSLVPLINLQSAAVGSQSGGRLGKRSIDWAGWKNRRTALLHA